MNAVAPAAVTIPMNAQTDPALLAHVADTGRWLGAQLRAMADRTGTVRAVRGVGFIWGVDTHERAGTILGGVHFELTGENVTECVGGARGLSEAELERDYRTVVDPRLNCEQALEMAMRIASRMKPNRFK